MFSKLFCCCIGKKSKSKKASTFENLKEIHVLVIPPAIIPTFEETFKKYSDVSLVTETKRDVQKSLKQNRLKDKLDFWTENCEGAALSGTSNTLFFNNKEKEFISDSRESRIFINDVEEVASTVPNSKHHNRKLSVTNKSSVFNYCVKEDSVLETKLSNSYDNKDSKTASKSPTSRDGEIILSVHPESNKFIYADISKASTGSRLLNNDARNILSATSASKGFDNYARDVSSDTPESNVSGHANKAFNVTPESTVSGAPFESTYLNKCASNQNSTITVKTTQIEALCTEINLCILVKTSMHSKFCYLAFDRKRKRIFRPIYRTMEEQCCWDNNLVVDRTYTFKVLQFPNDNTPPVTMLPHGNDDLLVEHQVKRKRTNNDSAKVFNELELIAKNTLEEIFIGMCKKKYVIEREDSPSLGVLRCHGANIRVFLVQNRIKVQIGRYNFPYTGLDTNNEKTLPYVDSYYPALVILGLARPWRGHHLEYCPRRCTILVLRIMQLPE